MPGEGPKLTNQALNKWKINAVFNYNFDTVMIQICSLKPFVGIWWFFRNKAQQDYLIWKYDKWNVKKIV